MEEILKGLESNDSDAKGLAINQLREFLNSNLEMAHLDEITKPFIACMKSNIILVCLKALEVSPLLLSKFISLQKPLKLFISSTVTILIDRLADSKEKIRETSLNSLYQFWYYLNQGILGTQTQYSKNLAKGLDDFIHLLISNGLQHKNWKAREQTLSLIIKCAEETSDFPLEKFTTTVLNLVEDSNELVRSNSKKLLLDYYPSYSPVSRDTLHRKLTNTTLKKAFIEQLNSKLIEISKEESIPSNKSSDSISYNSFGKSNSDTNVPDGFKGLFDSQDLSRESTQSTLSPTKSMSNELNQFEKAVPYSGLLNEIEKLDLIDVYDEKDFKYHLSNFTKTFIGKETDENWDIRDKEILKLRRILRGNGPKLYLQSINLFIKEIVDPLISTLLTVRTSLSSSAFNLVSDLSYFLPEGSLDPYSSYIFPTLIKCSSSSKKLTAEAAHKATLIFLSYTSYSLKTLSSICDAMQDKSANLRAYSADYLLVFLKKHATVRSSQFERRGIITGKEMVINAIKKGIKDANIRVRDLSRQLFWLFSSIWPKDSQEMLNQYDTSIRKQLLKEEGTLKTIPLSRKSSMSINSNTSIDSFSTVKSKSSIKSSPSNINSTILRGTSQVPNTRLSTRPSTSMSKFNTSRSSSRNSSILSPPSAFKPGFNTLSSKNSAMSSINSSIPKPRPEPLQRKSRPISIAVSKTILPLNSKQSEQRIVNKSTATVSKITPIQDSSNKNSVLGGTSIKTHQLNRPISQNFSRISKNIPSVKPSIHYNTPPPKGTLPEGTKSRIPRPMSGATIRKDPSLDGFVSKIPRPPSALRNISNTSLSQSRPKSVAYNKSNNDELNGKTIKHQDSNKEGIQIKNNKLQNRKFAINNPKAIDFEKVISNSNDNDKINPSNLPARCKTSIDNIQDHNFSGLINLEFPLNRNKIKAISDESLTALIPIEEENDNELDQENKDKKVQFKLPTDDQNYDNSSFDFRKNEKDGHSEVSSEFSNSNEGELKKAKTVEEKAHLLSKLIEKISSNRKASSSDFLMLDHISKDSSTSSDQQWEDLWKIDSNFDRLVKLTVRSLQYPSMPWEYKLPYVHLLNNLVTYQSPLANTYSSEIFSILIDCRKGSPRDVDSAAEDALIAFSKYLDLNRCLLISIRWLQACLLITKGSLPELEDFSVPITSGFMVLTKSISRALPSDLELLQPDLNSLVGSGFLHFSTEVRHHALSLVLAVKEQLGPDFNIQSFFPRLTTSQLNLIHLYEEAY